MSVPTAEALAHANQLLFIRIILLTFRLNVPGQVEMLAEDGYGYQTLTHT